MKHPMNEVSPQLQGTFYGAAIAVGFILLGLWFPVCAKLHRRVKENERNLQEQHLRKSQVGGRDLWDSMQQKGSLDQRIQSVDRLDCYIILVGGASVGSGVVGLIVLGFKDAYGFTAATGTLAALLVELLPFINLATVLAALFVFYRAINLARWFERIADVALPTSNRGTGTPPTN